MTPFGHYARCYDLLYRDKDYPGESRYVLDLLAAHGSRPDRLLDLGCGTGAHAEAFAADGVEVLGIDQSAEMLERAAERLSGLPPALQERLAFQRGDIRQFDLQEVFPVVTALFHVMSYQVQDTDLDATAAAVARHLAPGGLFLFDCWYGPAVLAEPPEVRSREVADKVIRATRTAYPTHYEDQHRVDVEFVLDIEDRQSGETGEVRETHRMRYLFLPELDALLSRHGMAVQGAYRWLTQEPVDATAWYACIVADKR